MGDIILIEEKRLLPALTISLLYESICWQWRFNCWPSSCRYNPANIGYSFILALYPISKVRFDVSKSMFKA